MPTPSNSLNISQPGLVTFDGTSAFSEIAAGASGNVLTSNGTTWASTPLPFNLQQSTRAVITSQQIKSLVGSPVLLIPTAGPNTIIIVQQCMASFIYGGTDPYSGSPSPRISYSPTTLAVSMTTTIAGTASKGFTGSGPGSISSSGMNKDVILANITGVDYTGNSTNDNYMVICINYFVYTVV